MTMFKIGDVVEITTTRWEREFSFGTRHEVLSTAKYAESAYRLKPINGGLEGIVDHGDIKLISSTTLKEESAKDLLTSLGYTITPPKPKLTGKVWIKQRDRDGVIQPSYNDVEKGWTIIAIVDWVEGEGI